MFRVMLDVSRRCAGFTAQPWHMKGDQNRLLFKSQSSRPDRCRRQMWPCSFFPLDRLNSSALAHAGASEQVAFQVTEFTTRKVPQTYVAMFVLST
mmetsp:Transcript_122338/g.391188  ORF Transcript_122338/g.391188 Transcript_122338/m.391188 type:complete len:95 (-) Transcript_122338:94-378(-)